MNAFHVLGAVLAVWALLVSMLGIRRPDFPGGRERVVAALSIVLVAATIAAAIITSAAEEHHEEGGEQAAAALRL